MTSLHISQLFQDPVFISELIDEHSKSFEESVEFTLRRAAETPFQLPNPNNTTTNVNEKTGDQGEEEKESALAN